MAGWISSKPAYYQHIDKLISAVIVRGSNGYTATVRFTEPSLDIIYSAYNKDVLYGLIAQRLR